MRQLARTAEVRAEHLLTDLLQIQGWDTRKPPAGEFLRQHEYKDYPHLLNIFAGRSKHGTGASVPEGVLIDRNYQPLAVMETKSTADALPIAIRDVRTYGTQCVEAGFNVLTIAVAGNSEEHFEVLVSRWNGSDWEDVTYEGTPISWIPNRSDFERLRAVGTSAELRPSVPSPETLASHAEEINRMLRESSVKDEFRPSVVAAIMLALWKSRGDLRKDPKYLLEDINRSCQRAFWDAQKPDLAGSLRVDEHNDKLAVRARRIVTILERLNVTVLTAEHDYLGQLYETFFRYTGGNTIGQFFTPRHVTSFMADLTEVGPQDVVLDPACGTGGFLIAAMNRMQREGRLSREETVSRVQSQLIGFESEPQTAALCVANMILRGDGKTGVHRGDCFRDPDYPNGRAHVSLMNPPFPHKKTDVPPETFIERALEGLQNRGELATIVQQSLLVKREKQPWRQRLLQHNTLEAVIILPDELFQPYASANTAILVIRKGVAHRADHSTFFARITHDGLRMKKRVRIPQDGDQIPIILEAFREHLDIPGVCKWSRYKAESGFAPGAYIDTDQATDQEVVNGVLDVVRRRTAFVALHAAELVSLDPNPGRPYWEIRKRPAPGRAKGLTIGGMFDVYYGQKALHNKEGLVSGSALVISSSGMDNGCYGFFDFEDLISPPFVTVPSTGSIAEAHVQEWPCGVTDDCLVLIPKQGVSREWLYIAAAMARREKWRFSYGRKATPDRIAEFPVSTDEGLLEHVRNILDQAATTESLILSQTADLLDTEVARTRIRELEEDPSRLIRGDELRMRLEQLGID